MFRALPIEGHKNIIQPAIFGVSRWLPFEGENKEIYQSGLVFAFPDAYQMGEKFSKSFIKIEFSCSIPWEEKIIFEKTLYFSRSRAPPLEGIFRKFRKPFIKSAFSCSTTWEGKFFAAKARFLVILVAYLLREEKYIFSKGLIFSLSRDLPLEGRKLQNRHNFWPLPVGTSEGIFKTGVKKLASRCLLFEGRKFFWEWLPKRPLSVGISEEKIIPWNPHISNFLAGYSLGEQNFFENTY